MQHHKTTTARAVARAMPSLKTSAVLLLMGAACLMLIGCGGEGNCYVEGCTLEGSGDSATTTTTTTIDDNSTTGPGTGTTAPQNDDQGNPPTPDAPTVVVVVVPSTGGDTSAGGGTTVGSEIAEPLNDAPTTTADNDNRATFIIDELHARPTVDGSGTTSEWGAVLPRELATWIIRDNSKIDRGGASARIGWFGGDLYISAHIPDTARGGDDPFDVWQDDSGEIMLDLGGEFGDQYDANDYQILTRHAGYGPQFVRSMFGINSSNIGRPQVRFACRYHNGTRAYACEYVVEGLGLYAGRTIGFDFQINDDDDGGSRDHKTGLCPGNDFADQAWFMPSAMCRLVFR